ncbi:MAG: zf-HC2 domain-containing protein, partial [Sedimentisphaerales bacterium]|nr:zf-HC2 domain-containing protein [Sedimentisphaerales bacterium]
MNCIECKEILVAYLEGLLAEDQKHAVTEHLKDCHSCQDEVKQLTDLQERLVSNGKAAAQSDLENEVLNRIIREQKVRLNVAEKATAGLKLRRLIMKSPVTRVAVAAAVIIVAAIGILSISQPSITFAQVVEPILNAKTIIFDSFIGDEETGTSMHEMIVGQKIRRTISNVPGMTMIVDPEASKMLVLTDADNSAAYVDISGTVGEQHQSFITFLHHVITKVQDNSENLGEQEIDGQKAIVFEAGGPNEGIKIWADPKTALPIRIELTLGQMFTIMKNFQFDPEIDESLVSMNVPAGYTLAEAEFDMTDVTEESFIESLRIWAKIIRDGTFPEEIGTESTMKLIPVLGQKMIELNLPEQETTQMGMNFGKGMIFHQGLETGGNEWHYAGNGVKLGDASKPVFWYLPDGSDTYRVIYGDLSVKDVA